MDKLELARKGYYVIEMYQTKHGTASQKMMHKVIHAMDSGNLRVAVLTNQDNPSLMEMHNSTATLNRNIPRGEVHLFTC